MLKYPPARSSFPADATEEETEIMNEHIQYWTSLMNAGSSLVFGPVMDPKGWYGVGIVEADNEEMIRDFIDSDPAIKAGLMNPEFYPMNAIVPEK